MTEWFVSHPSGAPYQTPTFFRALKTFATEHDNISIHFPPRDVVALEDRVSILEQADLIIAEVSIASTGSGIELGLARGLGKSIIAFHQGAAVISPALQVAVTAMHTYLTEEDITKVLHTLA